MMFVTFFILVCKKMKLVRVEHVFDQTPGPNAGSRVR